MVAPVVLVYWLHVRQVNHINSGSKRVQQTAVPEDAVQATAEVVQMRRNLVYTDHTLLQEKIEMKPCAAYEHVGRQQQ